MPIDHSSALPSSSKLQRQAERGAPVSKGAEGAAVREAQALLHAHGFDPGPADGDMGALTSKALRAFQASRGVAVDGVIGQETLRELRTPTAALDRRAGTDRGLTAGSTDRVPGQTGEELRRRARLEEGRRAQERPSGAPAPGEVELAPRTMSERQKFDHYAAIVRKNGGEMNPDGKPTVLGIRGMDIHGNKHSTTSSRTYDDTFVVLTADKRVLELKGATHPGQKTSTLSRDANGTRAVGMIDPGNFMAAPNGDHGGAASFRVSKNGSGSLKGARDTDGDGTMSAAERNASARRGDALTGVLFHQGSSSTPKSIGCLTLSPADWSKVLARVGGSGFSFSLVDANR